MAKKPTKKKTTTKTRKKTASRRTSASKKKTATKKTAAKKTTAKKTATKKSVKKKTPKKKKTATKAAAAKKKKKKTTVKKTPAAKSRVSRAVGKTKTSEKKHAPAAGPPDRAGAKKTAAAAKPKSKPKRKTGSGKLTSRKKPPSARSVAEAATASKADAEGYVFINGRRVRMISTGGQTSIRKTRSAKPTLAAQESQVAQEKPIKTSLSPKQLAHFRNLLLLKRAELIGDLSAMEEAALQASGGNLSNLPIHMADIGTDTYDQDFMLGLAENERQRLREIDDALKRIQDKTYGVCQMTGKPIPEARLEAKPWAKYTIEAARALEGQWRP